MLNSRVIKLGLMIVGLGVASAALAQSVREQQIAERLQPVGSVCLAGEACATGGSAPAAGGSVAQAGGATFSAQGTYDQYCAMCHNTGMAGAPRREDADHWTARIEEIGLETVVTNAINGINAMPPRGMCATCTDEQIGEVVQYLSGASAE